MKYTPAKPPLVCMLTTNPCYQATYQMKVRGVLWHSTGANNPLVRRYVQPAANDPDRVALLAKLGVNKNGNDWGHTTREVGVNAFVGRLADGTVAAVQTMPWNYAPWGCASGKNGSCNDGWIQFEICEDDLTDRAYFEAAYKEAVELTAYLCKRYGLDPQGTVKYNGVTVPVILCHQDSYRLGLGNNHGDVYTWFGRYGKTMDDVRRDAAALMKNEMPAQPEEDDDMLSYEQFKVYMERYEAERAALPGSGWSEADRAWAVEQGLIQGDGGGRMRWRDPITREETAAMFRREAQRTDSAT